MEIPTGEEAEMLNLDIDKDANVQQRRNLTPQKSLFFLLLFLLLLLLLQLCSDLQTATVGQSTTVASSSHRGVAYAAWC